MQSLPPSSTSSAEQHYPRAEDQVRLQRLIDEINSRNVARRQAPYEIDSTARALIMDYAAELTKSIVSASSLLSSHRNSSVIEEKDISIVFAKKLGIELAGGDRPTVLHHYNFKSSIEGAEKGPRKATENVPERVTGSKRKSTGGEVAEEE